MASLKNSTVESSKPSPPQKKKKIWRSKDLRGVVHVYKCVSHAWEQVPAGFSTAARIISHC